MMSIPWLQHEISIDEYSGQNGSHSLEARIVDPAAENQEKKLYRKELIQLVRKAVGNLSERERYIITNRFGILGGDEGTLDEVAADLNLSRERVRQIECFAKARLRRDLRSCSPTPMLAGG